MHPALILVGGGAAWLAVALAVALAIGRTIRAADMADERSRRASLQLVTKP